MVNRDDWIPARTGLRRSGFFLADYSLVYWDVGESFSNNKTTLVDLHVTDVCLPYVVREA